MSNDGVGFDPVEPGASAADRADWTRRWVVRTSIAIFVSLAMFTAVTYLLFRNAENSAEIIGAARLTWNPETDDPLGEGKAASVEIISDDDGYRVFIFDIEVLRPPADFEMIEAWLVEDDEPDNRLSVGTFESIRTRQFPLADGVDPLVYDQVEFSLEPVDGDPTFSGRTLMRGNIVWIVDPPG